MAVLKSSGGPSSLDQLNSACRKVAWICIDIYLYVALVQDSSAEQGRVLSE